MTARYLIVFKCGHSRETHFKYAEIEMQWQEGYCIDCHAVKAVNKYEPLPDSNSKEVDL